MKVIRKNITADIDVNTSTDWLLRTARNHRLVMAEDATGNPTLFASDAGVTDEDIMTFVESQAEGVTLGGWQARIENEP